MILKAVVLSPGQQYLQVLVPELGEDGRIYFEDQKRKKKKKEDGGRTKDDRRSKEVDGKEKEVQEEKDNEETETVEGEKREEWEIVASKWDEITKINEVRYQVPFFFVSISFYYVFNIYFNLLIYHNRWNGRMV